MCQPMLFGSPTLTRNFAIFNMQPVILDQSNANPLRFMFHTNCSLERTLKWMLNDLFDLCEGWMGLSSRSTDGTGVKIWMFQASSPFGACSSQQATSAKPGAWCAIFCGHVGYWQARLSYKRTLDLRIQRTDHRWKAEKYRWSLNTFEEVTCPTNIQQLYLFDRNPFFPTASILMFWNAATKSGPSLVRKLLQYSIIREEHPPEQLARALRGGLMGYAGKLPD